MAKKFEVGKTYEPYQDEFDAITIIRRTDKTVWVNNGQCEWRMRIKHDWDGNEYVVDSSVGSKWRDAFTFSAEWERSMA